MIFLRFRSSVITNSPDPVGSLKSVQSLISVGFFLPVGMVNVVLATREGLEAVSVNI